MVHLQRKFDLHQVDLTIDNVYDKLQEALEEILRVKNEAREGSHQRRRLEMELLDANRRARMAETNYGKEMELRKGTQRELRVKLLASDQLISSLQMDKDELEKGQAELSVRLDNALREVEALRLTAKVGGSNKLLEPSCLELEKATKNFDESLKIGEYRHGSVYSGLLNNTTVTITILQAHCPLGPAEFYQEVEGLSKLRHPNLVCLLGACSEKRALVCESLPNGSLENRLSRKDEAPPLPWKVRLRISAEICSALVFLHKSEPEGIVHGDVRPANILLGENFLGKLTNLGIGRLISSDDTNLLRWSDPKESFTYMDPELFPTGKLTARSDAYSCGIVLLRLLTGLPAMVIVKEMEAAVHDDRVREMLDVSAGDWSLPEAEKAAQVALRCCEMNRENRADLAGDVHDALRKLIN